MQSRDNQPKSLKRKRGQQGATLRRQNGANSLRMPKAKRSLFPVDANELNDRSESILNAGIKNAPKKRKLDSSADVASGQSSFKQSLQGTPSNMDRLVASFSQFAIFSGNNSSGLDAPNVTPNGSPVKKRFD